MKKTVSFSKDSRNIFFHILTLCNLKCRHCYINPEQHGKNTLPISTIDAWLNLFADDSANVIFLGGEPTLHPDLSSAIRKAKELGYASITVDTNGYLFHDILSKVRPDEVDYFSFSLDGATREVNDRIRGEGSYDACTAGIRKAVERGFHTSLIYTVSNENLHELHRMPPLLKELGIQRFFIQVIGIRGKSAECKKYNFCAPNDSQTPAFTSCSHAPAWEQGLQVSREKWLTIIPHVAEEVANFGITVTYPKVFLEREELFECAGLVADNYFIFPNGRVYRCPLCEDYPLHSMMIDEDNYLIKLEKINESDLFGLSVPEGCVMNKLVQPDNLSYNADGSPAYKIACCMLKVENLTLS